MCRSSDMSASVFGPGVGEPQKPQPLVFAGADGHADVSGPFPVEPRSYRVVRQRPPLRARRRRRHTTGVPRAGPTALSPWRCRARPWSLTVRVRPRQTGSCALREGISKDSAKCGSLSAGDVVLVRYTQPPRAAHPKTRTRSICKTDSLRS